MRIEIAYTNATYFSTIHIFFQYTPCFLDISLYRPVDKHKVDVIRSEVGKAFVKRLPHRTVSHFRSIHFRGNEKFAAVNTAQTYAFAYLFFITVTLCRINQTKPCLDSMAYTFCGIVLDKKRAYSQLRHFHAIVQFDCWYFIHILCICLVCHAQYKDDGKD